MKTRSRSLAGLILLLVPHAWSQAAGHSVSRPDAPTADSSATANAPSRSSPATFDDPVLDSLRDAESKRRQELREALGLDSSGAPAPQSNSTKGHWRAGLHASAHDVGLLLGASVRTSPLSLGFDGWVRPGVFTKEVRTTPTRRAQYKEVLWGFVPWVQAEIGSEFRLALVASLDMTMGTWYGTNKSPDSDIQPALGVKLLFPQYFQFGLRGTIGEGLLGRVRGEAVCEF
ncbi:MAG TPA: hypothetical protein PKO15_07300 [Fibrobacteria bacterium]|nr:hypothetical protein [Fibrobacteria bacterium]HOX50961.1 hypothetical protein [Fibrobacteria bacterium]